MTQLQGDQGLGGGVEGAFIDVSKIDPQKFANKPALAMVFVSLCTMFLIKLSSLHML